MLTIAAMAAVLAILLFAEYMYRYKNVHSELTRKFAHIIGGVFVATWPFFLSWRMIQLLSVLYLLAAIISVKFNIFKAVHSARRSAMGEVLAAVVIGILAFVSTDPWVFAAAMLCLALGDGLAAVVGLAYGKNNSYKILGRTKSVAGSLAFFIAAAAVMIIYKVFSGNELGVATILWLPAVATVAENLSGEGTDNLVVPLLVALALTSFA